MARYDGLMKGVGIGLSAAVLLPVVFSTLAPILRPLARTALRAGVMVYEKGREIFEEFGETVEDVVAEVREELVDAHESEALIDELEEEAAVQEDK